MLYIVMMIPVMLFVFALIDVLCGSGADRYEEHCELMDELERQGLDAEARHAEIMAEKRKSRELMERKRSRMRRERQIIRSPDGTVAAREITEEDV